MTSQEQSLRETTYTIDDLIFDIEDYVGGNIEGIEAIDRMAFTSYLRQAITKVVQESNRQARIDERASVLNKIEKEVIGHDTQTFHAESGLSDFADMDLNIAIEDLKRWVSKGIGGHIGNREFEDFKVKIINRIPHDVIERGRNELRQEFRKKLEALKDHQERKDDD